MTWIHSVVQDLRYAGRMMQTRPGFAAAAILSLALGIGANTAMFSLLDALLLEHLPVRDPQALVRLTQLSRDGGSSYDTFTYRTYEDLRHATSLSSLVAMTVGSDSEIDEAGERSFASVQLVSDNYFDVLGVGTLQGRLFHDFASAAAGEPIAVISEDYWLRHFRGAASAIGARIRRWGRDFTVIGVAARSFRGAVTDRPVDIWIPFDQVVAPDDDDRTRGRWVRVMGRLAPGRTIHEAEAESAAILRRTVKLEPGATGYSNLRKQYTRPLLLVEIVAFAVLLITCANLANLMLAGTAAREPEMAIRRSVGASRARVAGQLFTESLLLASIGAAMALVTARWITAGFLGFLPADQAPAVAHLAFELDLKTLGFTALLACLSCVLFAVGPVLAAARQDITAYALRRQPGSSRGSWTSRTLIAGQIALCLPLLLVAGVFLRTLQNLRGQEAGYEEHGLLVADVDPPRQYSEERRDQLFEELRQRLAALPEVRIAAFSHVGQLSGSGLEWRIGFPGRTYTRDEAPEVLEHRITPGFFRAMGTDIVVGRGFTSSDTARSTPVAIVNESFARTFLPGVNPIGQRFFREGGSRSREPMEIVGVVRDSKWVNLREGRRPMYYRPYMQMGGTPVVRFAIRADGDLQTLTVAVRQTAQALDRRLVLRNVVPFRAVVDRTLVVERLIGHVSAAFSVLALSIAAVGLYGVGAYAVARRTKEIGVRMAVGASARSVEWMIVRESLVLFAAGCAIGIPLSIAAGRATSALLFGLDPHDPLTVATVLFTLLAAVAGATYLPARRAAGIDPVVALRQE